MTDPRRDLGMREAQHSFDVVLRGFDRHQVAETIERLEADIRVALADRDAAMTRSTDLAGQLQSMHGEIDQLRRKAASAGPTTLENMSERISHMLRLAEEEAAEIRQAATPGGREVLREQTAAEERAHARAARRRAGRGRADPLSEARHNAEQIATKAQIRADELVAKAQEKVARLDAESQARRAKVEEDFELTQRARSHGGRPPGGGARPRLRRGGPPAGGRGRAACSADGRRGRGCCAGDRKRPRRADRSAARGPPAAGLPAGSR